MYNAIADQYEALGKGDGQDIPQHVLKGQDVEGGLRRYLAENDPGTYKKALGKLGLSKEPLREFHESKAKAAGLPFYNYLMTLR